MTRFVLITLLGLLSLGLRAADTPVRRIPVEDFFRYPAFRGFQVSPSGKYLAALAANEKTRRVNLFIIDLKTRKPTPVTNVSTSDVASFSWVTDDRLLFDLDEDGFPSMGLYAVDRDGSNMRMLQAPLTERSGANILRMFTPMDLLRHGPKSGRNEILVETNERRIDHPEVVVLNVRTGTRRPYLMNDQEVSGWLTDQDGNVRIGVATKPDRSMKVVYRATENAPWETIAHFQRAEENWTPVAFMHEGNKMYVRSNVGRDTYAIYEYDLDARQLGRLVYEDERYDVSGVIMSDFRRRMVGVRYAAEKPKSIWFDEEKRVIQDLFDRSFPDQLNVISSQSDDETVMVVSSGSSRHPLKYYLVQIENGRPKVEELGNTRPWLKAAEMAELKPVRIPTRDGKSLSGYLMLPVGAQKNVPLILNPHGGPWARDDYRFNAELQFFANRGFAVLQVNFRGSAGFGRSHLMAGRRQFGRLMQDDLTDSVKWAINEGIADPKRVGIYGASYGGYATMAGLVFTPELYRWGINYVGVVDLIKQVKWYDEIGNESGYHYWRDMVGDPDKDREMLEAASPVNFISRLSVPLFVVHGERDPRVSIRQADALIRELKKHDKPFSILIKNDEGHGFVKEKNQVELYTKLDEFLAKHGGVK